MDVISEGDVSPMEVGSGMIEMVKNFTYLCSNLSSGCEATCEVKCWITKASKVLVPLKYQYFLNVNYLLILRALFIMLWSFPSSCMVLKCGH